MHVYQDDLKEHLLVDLHELLIPLFDVGGALPRVGVILVMLAPLDNLLEDGFVDLNLAIGY